MATNGINGGKEYQPAAQTVTAADGTTRPAGRSSLTKLSNAIQNRIPGAPAPYDRASLVGDALREPWESEEQEVPFFWVSSVGELWRFLLSWMIPGMGMFCEAYFIFSIGNIKPLLQQQMPTCFKTYADCNQQLVQSIDYLQIVGIIVGMFVIGYLGDVIGRKWGSVMTVCIMLFGCILLSVNLVDGLSGGTGFVIFYMVSQFVFGFGVGGEYPMAAGSAAERAEAGGPAKARKRGAEVVLTFSMQGVGNFTNVAVLLILLCIFNATSATGVSQARITSVWRIAFALGAIPLTFLIYYRIFILRESALFVKRSGSAIRQDFVLLLKFYWPRLLSTAGCWFLWDFSFYGNKVFQSTFIGILSPGASPTVTLLWTLLNSFCALVGYYCSALFVDNIYLGRLRIQFYGFVGVAILFYVSAACYGPLTTPGGIGTFQFIYFLSSFIGQFGPNCTTFLLAGEVYPTALRTTAHGLSAALAKCGALWAAAWFNYLQGAQKFWSTATFNVAGAIATLLFTPNTMHVSITEQDRRFHYLKTGQVYHGQAIKPVNLSFWEILTGQAKHYNKSQDAVDRHSDGFATEAGAHGPAKVVV